MTKRLNVCRSAIDVLALVSMLIAAGALCASATDIVVTTLSDVADPPFDADDLCGTGTVENLPGADGHVSLREAISAANHSRGPHTITFAAELSGGTLSIAFDGPDADTNPDPLPYLCNDGIALNGDTNGDNVPDITLRGSAMLPTLAGGITILASHDTVNGLKLENFPAAGIVVFHPASGETAAADNMISNNVVQGGTFPIVIQAGSGDPASAGHVANTTVTGNHLSQAATDGILVITGNAAGSTINGTSIANNQVTGNARFGILVTTHLSSAGHNTAVLATTIRNNEVSGNGSTGIAAFSFAGQGSTINGLLIDGNDIHDNAFGMSGAGGVCGATANTMQLTITDNTLDTSGIIVNGGTNILCPSGPLAPASGNTVTATISGNTLRDTAGPGITVTGGTVNAHDNTASVTMADNVVAGLTAITVIGGLGISGQESGPADRNQVGITVRDSQVGQSFAGISIVRGASGMASDNAVTATVEHNVACHSLLSGIQCSGGFPGALGLPANQGSGNAVHGSFSGNFATSIVVDNGVAGNTCQIEQGFNAACLLGDASCNGRVTAADIPALLQLLAAGQRAFCGLDDADGNGGLDSADIVATIAGLFPK